MFSGLLNCCVGRPSPAATPLLAEATPRRSNQRQEEWLSEYQAKRVLDLWVIPGTHHSGVQRPKKRVSQAVWGWAQTQDASIAEQLRFGVRFLDFRVRVAKGQVILSHGLSSDLRLDVALETVRGFLENHHTEFVIVYVRADKWHEITPEGVKAVRECLLGSRIVFCPALENFEGVRVGDLAGKAVFFSPDVSVPKVTWKTELLDYCDIWQEPTVEDAQKRINNYVRYLKGKRESRGALVGIALDGAFPVKQQCYTSKELNAWFLSNIKTNREWSGMKSLGLCIIDFATEEFVDQLLRFNKSTKTVRISENGDTITKKALAG